jgi:hypothetical protein
VGLVLSSAGIVGLVLSSVGRDSGTILQSIILATKMASLGLVYLDSSDTDPISDCKIVPESLVLSSAGIVGLVLSSVGRDSGTILQSEIGSVSDESRYTRPKAAKYQSHRATDTSPAY